MTRRLALLVCVVCLTTDAGAAAGNAPFAVPINAGGFAGTFHVSSFDSRDGQILASGLLSGELQTAAGAVTVINALDLQVAIGEAGCEKLRLDLAPQELALPGRRALLDGGGLELTPQSRTAELLCAAADARGDAKAFVKLLNKLVHASAE